MPGPEQAPLLADERASDGTRFGQRHVLLVVLALCNLCLYLNRANISVAITFMYRDCGGDAQVCKDASQQRDCAVSSHCTWHDQSTTRSVVLAAFYWGYLLSQIPAGAWASKVGGKRVLATAVATWSVATALAAPAYGWLPGLVMTRILVGAAEGANYPAQVVLNAQWIPRAERSRAWAFVTSGESIGTILAMLVCPFMAHNLGWTSIFWMSSIVGVVWLLLFFVAASATPEEAATHGGAGSCCGDAFRISPDELHLIASARGELVPPSDVPWRSFVRNSAFRALIVAHFCYNYGYYVVLSWLPTYFKNMFNADYSSMGVYGMLPYIGLAVVSNVGGKAADMLLARGVQLTTVRRIFNTVGFLSPAVCFFCLRFIKPCANTSCSGFGVAVTLFTVGTSLGGLAFSGYWANFIDLSPRFAGHLMGVSNSVATIPGIVGNLVTGQILKGHENDWGIVFSLAAAIYVFGAVVFVAFARAELQNFDVDESNGTKVQPRSGGVATAAHKEQGHE